MAEVLAWLRGKVVVLEEELEMAVGEIDELEMFCWKGGSGMNGLGE